MKTMAPLNVAVLLFLGIQSSASSAEFKMHGAARDSERVTNDICEDCSEIFELVADIFTNADYQRKLMDNLEVLCDLLPNPSAAGKICRQQVEQMLPVAINFLTATVKPEQVCSFLGLCGTHSEEDVQRQLINDIQESLSAAIKALDRSDGPWAESSMLNDGSTIQCTYCMVILDALQKMFPKEKAEVAVVQVLLGACGLVPASYQPRCEALVQSFTKTLLDTLLSRLTPRAVCSLVQMCGAQEGAPSGEPVPDPCTVQSFSCRDWKTAARCRTVLFCQKFVWKSSRNTPF